MFNRLKDERGFTLIELLVVVLIIGILAAVALPTFLGQRDKGFDADAKSNARNLQTMVESCGVDNAGDYTQCDTAAELTTAGANVGSLPIGTGAGQVRHHGRRPGRVHHHGVLEVQVRHQPEDVHPGQDGDVADQGRHRHLVVSRFHSEVK